MDHQTIEHLYNALLQQGGGVGEAFNKTEYARAGQDIPGISSLSPEILTQLNRYAQGADSPVTGLLAAPYEGLKAAEQSTGVPVLSGLSKALNSICIPVSAPDETTSDASLGNVTASLGGSFRGLRDILQNLRF